MTDCGDLHHLPYSLMLHPAIEKDLPLQSFLTPSIKLSHPHITTWDHNAHRHSECNIHRVNKARSQQLDISIPKSSILQDDRVKPSSLPEWRTNSHLPEKEVTPQTAVVETCGAPSSDIVVHANEPSTNETGDLSEETEDPVHLQENFPSSWQSFTQFFNSDNSPQNKQQNIPNQVKSNDNSSNFSGFLQNPFSRKAVAEKETAQPSDVGKSLSNKFSSFFRNALDKPQLQGQRSVPHTRADRNEEFDDSSSEPSDAMQHRLRSMWNNMRYGWTFGVSSSAFDSTAHIHLLGMTYKVKPHNQGSPWNVSFDSNGPKMPPGLQNFYHDFASRLWFSYRYGFATLPNPQVSPSVLPLPSPSQEQASRSKATNLAASLGLGLGSSQKGQSTRQSRQQPAASTPDHTTRTSDSGWGCMLRCGQMLMAQALLLHFLSRDWRYYTKLTPIPAEEMRHRQIIRWFGDIAAPECPFSVHRLLQLSGKKAGHWFGASSVCQLLVQSLRVARTHHPDLDNLDAYLGTDRQIFVRDIRSLFCKQQDDHGCIKQEDLKVESMGNTPSCCSRSVLLLIPLYLGDARGFQETHYATPLLRMFREASCVGFIGGRPKHSLYFVGSQGRELIYLDPHFSQPVVHVLRDCDFSTATFHCAQPRKMPLNKIDPSGAVGFYCHTVNELYNLLQCISLLKPDQPGAYPLVEVLPGRRPRYSEVQLMEREAALAPGYLDTEVSWQNANSPYTHQHHHHEHHHEPFQGHSVDSSNNPVDESHKLPQRTRRESSENGFVML